MDQLPSFHDAAIQFWKCYIISSRTYSGNDDTPILLFQTFNKHTSFGYDESNGSFK